MSKDLNRAVLVLCSSQIIYTTLFCFYNPCAVWNQNCSVKTSWCDAIRSHEIFLQIFFFLVNNFPFCSQPSGKTKKAGPTEKWEIPANFTIWLIQRHPNGERPLARSTFPLFSRSFIEFKRKLKRNLWHLSWLLSHYI